MKKRTLPGNLFDPLKAVRSVERPCPVGGEIHFSGFIEEIILEDFA